MNIQNINLIYFSPTGTTRKILNAIATGIGPLSFTSVNLTLPAESPFEKDFSHDELVIIGAPVYAGRIPTAAAERIKKLKGKNTPAVLIVLYGNREFDDALLELKDLSQELGFVPLAAGAFIGEHSFATRELPIANGRPDDNDIRTAAELGKKIRKRMESLSDITQMLPLTVPGNYPYREKGPSHPISPVTAIETCTLCGECALVCPTAAITLETGVYTHESLCIRCSACVKTCPAGARFWKSAKLAELVKNLSQRCKTRKEPLTIL